MGGLAGLGCPCATGSGSISGFLRLVLNWNQGQNFGRLDVQSNLEGTQTQSEGAGEARALGQGDPHSPPLRHVAGGREEVVAEGTADGTQDLQVVDDPVWGQVVPQRRPHHRVRHVLDTDETGREPAPGPAGPSTLCTVAPDAGALFFIF